MPGAQHGNASFDAMLQHMAPRRSHNAFGFITFKPTCLARCVGAVWALRGRSSTHRIPKDRVQRALCGLVRCDRCVSLRPHRRRLELWARLFRRCLFRRFASRCLVRECLVMRAHGAGPLPLPEARLVIRLCEDETRSAAGGMTIESFQRAALRQTRSDGYQKRWPWTSDVSGGCGRREVRQGGEAMRTCSKSRRSGGWYQKLRAQCEPDERTSWNHPAGR